MSVQVIDTLKPKNNGSFPVVEAEDVAVSDELRLPEALNQKAEQTDLEELSSALEEKADQSDLTTLAAVVNGKANTSDVTTATTNLQNQINEIIAPVTQDAEIQNARVGADGTSYSTLKSRLDAEFTETDGRLDASDKNGLYTMISGYVNGYGIDLTGETADLSSPVSSSNTRYVVYPCESGDLIHIRTDGANVLRAYAFLDSSNNILQVANPGAYINADFTAPVNTAKVVINNSQGHNYDSFIGRKLKERIENIFDNAYQTAYATRTWDNGFANYSFYYEIPISAGGIDEYGASYSTDIRGISDYITMFPGTSIVCPAGYEMRAAVYLDRSFQSLTNWSQQFINIGNLIDSSLSVNKKEIKILIRRVDGGKIYNDRNIKIIYCGVKRTKEPYVVSDKLIQTNTGYVLNNKTIAVNNDYICSMPIPVQPDKTYKCSVARNYIIYDQNLQFIVQRTGSGNPLMNTDECPDAAYVVFCWRVDDNIPSMFFAEENIFIGKEYLTIPVATSTSGKKLIWTGDSIPHGQVATGTAPAKPYPQIVAENLGMTLKNYSIGGSTLAKKSNYGGAFNSVDDFNSAEKDTSKYYQVIEGQTYTSYRYSGGTWISDLSLSSECRTPICERYSFMDNDAEIICVAAGTNDFQYNWTDIGEIAEVGSTFDRTTLYGAMQYLCEKLLQKYIKKTIIFCTPIKRAQTSSMTPATGNGDYPLPTSQNTKGKTLKDYGTIIKEVCDLYSIPVIDLYSISGLNPSLTSQSSLFDGWKTHPYQDGHNMITRVCTGQIKALIST